MITLGTETKSGGGIQKRRVYQSGRVFIPEF